MSYRLHDDGKQFDKEEQTGDITFKLSAMSSEL